VMNTASQSGGGSGFSASAVVVPIITGVVGFAAGFLVQDATRAMGGSGAEGTTARAVGGSSGASDSSGVGREVRPMSESEKRREAERMVAMLASAMEQMLADHGSEVALEDVTIEALYRAPAGVDGGSYGGPYVADRESLTDPWGHAFVLVVPAEEDGGFTVVSYGADGAAGGDGDAADIASR